MLIIQGRSSLCLPAGRWEERWTWRAGPSKVIVNNIVNEEKISWAIRSFHPYKSAGPDDIRPIMPQAVYELLLQWLLNIFRGCLITGYVPKRWREVIPKAGKINHCSPKDYRPISLSSFLVKTLERLLDLYLRTKLTPQAFSGAQHAYVKGRSVETVLHEVVRTIEGSL